MVVLTTHPRKVPMSRRRLVLASAAGLLALTLTAGACSSGGRTSSSNTTASTTVPAGAADPNAAEVNPPGDIPDNQAFVTYTPPAGGYHVDVPEGWARTENGGAVTFTDKLNSVRMETTNTSAAPTADSAKADEVPAIEAAAKSYEAGKVEAVTRTSGDAVLITYRADGSPDPVTGKVTHLDVERYEFWKDGTEVILTPSGPQGADNVDPWKIVTDSFGWQ